MATKIKNSHDKKLLRSAKYKYRNHKFIIETSEKHLKKFNNHYFTITLSTNIFQGTYLETLNNCIVRNYVLLR